MEVEAKDARERARKEEQEARFEAKQRLRQQMIDRVRRLSDHVLIVCMAHAVEC